MFFMVKNGLLAVFDQIFTYGSAFLKMLGGLGSKRDAWSLVAVKLRPGCGDSFLGDKKAVPVAG